MEKYKAYNLHNYRSIPQMDKVDEAVKRDIDIVGRVLPFKTNSYVVNELIDWEQVESDPIFTLNFPRRGMLSKKHYDTVARSPWRLIGGSRRSSCA